MSRVVKFSYSSMSSTLIFIVLTAATNIVFNDAYGYPVSNTCTSMFTCQNGGDREVLPISLTPLPKTQAEENMSEEAASCFCKTFFLNSSDPVILFFGLDCSVDVSEVQMPWEQYVVLYDQTSNPGGDPSHEYSIGEALQDSIYIGIDHAVLWYTVPWSTSDTSKLSPTTPECNQSTSGDFSTLLSTSSAPLMTSSPITSSTEVHDDTTEEATTRSHSPRALSSTATPGTDFTASYPELTSQSTTLTTSEHPSTSSFSGAEVDVHILARLRYWCQGKPKGQCKVTHGALHENVPEAVLEWALLVRLNVHEWTGHRCQEGCTFFPQSYTCYCTTSATSQSVQDHRDECRSRGGELARFFTHDRNDTEVPYRFAAHLVKHLDLCGPEPDSGKFTTVSLGVHSQSGSEVSSYDMARDGHDPIGSWDFQEYPAKIAHVQVFDGGQIMGVSIVERTEAPIRSNVRGLCEVPPFTPRCLEDFIDGEAETTALSSISNFVSTVTSDPTISTSEPEFSTVEELVTVPDVENLTTQHPETTTIKVETTTINPRNCTGKALPQIHSNYTYPDGQGNSWKYNDCPPGWQGKARWFCRVTGHWRGALPDMGNCTAFATISEAIDEVEEAEDISALLTNVTLGLELAFQQQPEEEGVALSAGDLINIATLLEKAALKEFENIDQLNSTEVKKERCHKYLKSMSGLSDQALRASLVTWQAMDDRERTVTATNLQIQMEEAAVKMLGFLEIGEKQNVTHFSHELVVTRFSRDDMSRQNSLLRYEYSSSSISVAEEKLEEVMDEADEDSVRVSFFGFSNLHSILNLTEHTDEWGATPDRRNENELQTPRRVIGVNTLILGAKVTTPSSSGSNSLPLEVTLDFSNIEAVDPSDVERNVSCVFWDVASGGGWSTDGCVWYQISEKRTTCICNHLTNFAVLVEIDAKLPKVIVKLLNIGTLIGCSISIVCLVASAVTFALVRTASNRQIDVSLTLSLAAAQLVLILGLDAIDYAVPCAIVAVLMHYLFLASCCWMFIKGLDVYCSVAVVFRMLYARTAAFYFLGGFGTPAVLVAITAAVSQGRAYGSDRGCWLNDMFTLTFVLPIALVTMANFAVVVLVLRIAIRRKKLVYCNNGARGQDSGAFAGGSRCTQPSTSNGKTAVGLAALLSALGLTWIFGIIHFAYPDSVTAIMFTLFNSTQGISIFTFWVLLNGKRRRAMILKTKLGKLFPSLIRKNGARASTANMEMANVRSSTSTSTQEGFEFDAPFSRTSILMARIKGAMVWNRSSRFQIHSMGSTTNTSSTNF